MRSYLHRLDDWYYSEEWPFETSLFNVIAIQPTMAKSRIKLAIKSHIL